MAQEHTATNENLHDAAITIVLKALRAVLLILVIPRMVLNVARKQKAPPFLLGIVATDDTIATAAIAILTIIVGSALTMTLKCAALARLEAVCVSRNAPWPCQGLGSMLITDHTVQCPTSNRPLSLPH
jgi:hypothetical protein